MEQLPLEIAPPPEPSFENFLAGPNGEALARVQALARGELPDAIVYLWGESGSGRSHLLHAAKRVNARLVAADDVESLDADAQQALFNAINEARAGGPAVLASGRTAPAQLALRADLRTRLAWGLAYQLQPPSDAQKADHLRAEAARRGLNLGEDVVGYLLTRMPRDLYSLKGILDRLDRLSLARQRPVTIPLVKEAFPEGTGSAVLPRQTGPA